eukprot:Clim_evm12s164 gene=Clim_evmTU12s164
MAASKRLRNAAQARRQPLDFQSQQPQNQKASQMNMFWVTLGLKLLVWVALFLVALEVQLGGPYFLLSILYLIYENLGERKPGEPSAFSVFNENFQRLQGEIDPQALDQSLRRGWGF